MARKPDFLTSERFVLFGYFIGLILIGSFLLSRPMSWSGASGMDRVPLVDAVFTAVSATCVTGLITVDTALWSPFGKMIILLLIQTGGLGIVTFGMLYLVLPKARISLKSTRLFGSSFIVTQMPRVRQMIGTILGITFTIEGIGAIILAWAFFRTGVSHPVFTGVFHSISAFCNAGFSLFSDGLVAYRSDLLVNSVLMVLIILGGIGFMVIRDIHRKIHDWRRPLLFHTRLMLIAVPLFIGVGFVGYFILDYNGGLKGLTGGDRVLAALFQSVTTRTAGFNTIDQAELTIPARWLTYVLMITGGGSGSTAGGIKISTVFILFVVLFRGVNERGDIRVLNRRISSDDVSRAAMFFLKAIALLFVSILSLGIVEHVGPGSFQPAEIVFESVSALGTVGLSMGITPLLTDGGKMIIAITMFAGRVGLFAMVIRVFRDRTEALIEYPKGEVLIG